MTILGNDKKESIKAAFAAAKANALENTGLRANADINLEIAAFFDLCKTAQLSDAQVVSALQGPDTPHQEGITTAINLFKTIAFLRCADLNTCFGKSKGLSEQQKKMLVKYTRDAGQEINIMQEPSRISADLNARVKKAQDALRAVLPAADRG